RLDFDNLTGGTDTIRITLATGSDGGVLTTAQKVKTLVEGNAAANSLVSVRFAEGTGANVVHAMTPQRLSGVAGEFTMMFSVDPRDHGADPAFPDPFIRPLLSKHTLGTNDGGWELYLVDDLDNPGTQKVVFRVYPIGGNTTAGFTTSFSGTDND